MIVILHYPQKIFRRQTPALFGLLIIVILRSALQKKKSGGQNGVVT